MIFYAIVADTAHNTSHDQLPTRDKRKKEMNVQR